jgi:diacylglycerol kinase
MNERGRFKAKARARGFVFAFRGLTHVVKTQHNMWIHLAITLAVIVAAVLLRVNKVDWLWLIISVTLVFFAEVINSAFEFLCDVVRPEHHGQRHCRWGGVAGGAGGGNNRCDCILALYFSTLGNCGRRGGVSRF